ncbi:Uncharacterised protein [uncultured archaeon]|nr:Uncharacterised protein [uncultured archaeon]
MPGETLVLVVVVMLVTDTAFWLTVVVLLLAGYHVEPKKPSSLALA